MKQHNIMKSLGLGAIFLLGGSSTYADVTWNGAIAPGTVTNQNIQISGSMNTLSGPVTVAATGGTTITVITLNAAVIQSQANGATLSFTADQTSTIIIDVTNPLTFQNGTAPTQPFVVAFEGQGTFMIKVACSLQFSLSTLNATYGTELFLVMDPNHAPTLTFAYGSLSPCGTLDTMVDVGPKCLISYLATVPVSANTSTEKGSIIFDPTVSTSCGGRFILNIADTGAVIVSGHQYTAPLSGNPQNINLAVPAGLQAAFYVQNSNLDGAHWSGLTIINGNQTYTPNLLSNPFCTGGYTGQLYGFVVQCNAVLGALTANTWIHHIGTALNVAPVPDQLLSCQKFLLSQIKPRNPSAFVIDGYPSVPTAQPAYLNFKQGESAFYLSSEVDCTGNTAVTYNNNTGAYSSTVTVATATPGAGNIVFDVEGPAYFMGASQTSGINILSLVTTVTGGSFIITSNNTLFPLRTFAQTAGSYQTWPKACALINNVFTFDDAVLKHDDAVHQIGIFLKGDNSLIAPPEPSWIGGERGVNSCPGNVNSINFLSSQLLLHTGLNVTGLTLAVPTDTNPFVPQSVNNSQFVFYGNGYCLGQGTGVSLVLGSTTGAAASDGSTIIDPSAQLDVIQTSTVGLNNTLTFTVGYNNQKVTQGLTANITGQNLTQQFVQLYASNFCVGSYVAPTASYPFTPATNPTLTIGGSYFVFYSQGGVLGNPTTSVETGQGAIFVDSQGLFNIMPNAKAFMGTAIGVSGNGVVNLPGSQVAFGQGIGIQATSLNLTNTSSLVIVGASQSLPTIVLDWKAVTQDFCTSGTVTGYVPYSKPVTTGACAYALASATPVTAANITGIPIIEGTVNQFVLKNSTFGNVATIDVQGGTIRELLYGDMSNAAPGTLALATIVVGDNAIVGLGTSSRNVSSVEASLVLGSNGITLIADGNAQVILNQDVTVDQYAAILTSPNFGVSGAQQLLITSQVPREFRVPTGTVLDLTQFGNYNQQLVFGGQVSLVLEPGAQVIYGSGQVTFTDQAQLVCEPYIGSLTTTGTTLSATDPYRVQFSTIATTTATANIPAFLTFKENSRFFIPRGALVGVETNPCVSTATSLSIAITDDAALLLGGDELRDEYGGGFQVGNTVNRAGSTVDFALILNGTGAIVEVGSQGFLGLGVGQVAKPESAPNNWLVSTLFNVRNISITTTEGTFADRAIYTGSNILANLVALGPISGSFVYSIDLVNGLILGGGNLISLNAATVAPFNPVVGSTFTTSLSSHDILGNVISYGVGILSSSRGLTDGSKTALVPAGNPAVLTGTPAQAFNYMAMNDYTAQISIRTAIVSQASLGTYLVAYINAGTIYRQLGSSFKSGTTLVGGAQPSLIGACGLTLITQPGYPPSPSYQIING